MLSMAFYNLGQAYGLLSNPQVVEGHFKSALSVTETCSANDHEMSYEYGLVLGRLAKCYSEQQMFTKAEDLYLQELNLAKRDLKRADNILQVC
jgi:tetratricopeptide (TPR) repeat protein